MVTKHMRVANFAHENYLWRLMWISIRKKQLEMYHYTFVVVASYDVAVPLHDVVFQWQCGHGRQLPCPVC
jgi:hypothetical protein